MIRQFELVERVRAYDKHADEEILNRAYVFAMKAHGAQKRASGDPYFSHPLEVAAMVRSVSSRGIAFKFLRAAQENKRLLAFVHAQTASFGNRSSS